MIRKIRNACLLAAVPLVFGLTTGVTKSAAEVNLNIGLNLPLIRFAEPPEVVVIPGTYVYAVPDVEADILFFEGYWWRPHRGQWFRSREYDGSWHRVSSKKIPRGLRNLPRDYRQRLSYGHERIPQHDVRKNWKKWEREKRWDRQHERGNGRPGNDRSNDGRPGKQNRGNHDRQDGRR